MTAPFTFDPPSDPLGRNACTPHALQLPVLGITTRFESNAAVVTEIAERAFGAWRALERVPDAIDPESVLVRFIVEEGDEGGSRAPLRYRMPDARRVLFASPGSAGIADPDRRASTAFVTNALVADAEHFRYGVLEALTLALLSQLDRQPVHAAAIVRDDTALLLAGPSGVGKSTLTYAATRAGWSALTEDVVYVQLRPRLRVWGLPGHVHLPADTRRLFPDLEPLAPTVLANGKTKIAVDLRSRNAVAPLPYADRAAFCLLARAGAGESPALHPLTPDDVAAALDGALEPGFDVFADTIGEVHRALAARGGWRMTVGPDPAAHLPLLREMTEQARRA